MPPLRSACAFALLLASVPAAVQAEENPAISGIITAKSWTPTTDRGTQFGRDVDFFYATVFPNVQAVDNLVRNTKSNLETQKGILDTQANNRILWRLFLAMAYGGLKFCTKSNDVAHLKDWPWNLATAVGHGQRVIFDLKGWDARDLYSLLVTGAVQKNFKDPFPRTAASHGFRWKHGKMEEVKYSGLSLVYAVSDGLLQGKHHGIDIAFGGVGNTRMDNLIIGPSGTALDPSRGYQKVAKLQHGHLFLHDADKYDGKKILVESGLMVGLEGSAPGTTNMYGSSHNAGSATADPTLETGVDGGQKMQKLLGNEAPAQIGGMWVTLDTQEGAELPKVIQALDNMSPSNRMELFRTILKSNGPSARHAVQDAYAKALQVRAGTRG